jgi:hypothetical protein
VEVGGGDTTRAAIYDGRMKLLLLLAGLVLMTVGACLFFLLAKSAIHEIEGEIIALMGVVSFSGGAIVGAIEGRR